MNKKNTIRLTESELKRVISESVKTILESVMNEGATSDLIKDVMTSDMSDEANITWDEFKELVNGNPNKAKYLYNKLMYNQAKSGNIGNVGNKKAVDFGVDAIAAEPGFKGKAKRAMVGAAFAGKTAFDKARQSFKNRQSNRSDDDVCGPFEV